MLSVVKYMMRHFIISLIMTNLVACNSADQTTEQTTTDSNTSSETDKALPPKTEEDPSADVHGCYMKITGRDTAILMIDQKGADITGKLLYDNFEKDGSRGTVRGKEEKEILKLWYDFQSEGMHSVMEVYFKKDNGRLIRGIGTMDVKSDTTYFTSGVNSSDKESFTKVECDSIKWKFD